MSNVEGMYSVYFKKTEQAYSAEAATKAGSKPSLRNSAVRCLIQAIEAASLIIKKTRHFGRVSYKV